VGVLLEAFAVSYPVLGGGPSEGPSRRVGHASLLCMLVYTCPFKDGGTESVPVFASFDWFFQDSEWQPL
jgi:hypothetical protein